MYGVETAFSRECPILVFIEKQDRGNRLELHSGTFRLVIRNGFMYLQDTRLPGGFENKNEWK